MSKLEINLSSSALGHAGCVLNLHRTIAEGYKEKAMASRMIYGVGFHKFTDVMYKTGGHIPTARDEAIKAFASIPRIDDRKSMHLSDVNHMHSVALINWTVNVMKDTEFDILELNDKPASELTFSLPIWEDEVAKYNWCGTIDRLGKIRGGCYVIKDWKSTSTWNIADYFTTYEMARQPRGYVLALKMMHELYPDSALGKIGATKVGAQFDGVFIKPAINDVRFAKSIVFQYEDKEIEEFKQLIISECQKLSMAIATNKFPKQGIVNGSCLGKWGKCAFWNVCQHPEAVANVLLKRDFDKKPFNPLAYNDL